jgi:peroxiredoxin
MTSPPLPYVDFSKVGPQIGERFPDIVLPDQHGTVTDLHSARRGRNALVVFYRSASW